MRLWEYGPGKFSFMFDKKSLLKLMITPESAVTRHSGSYSLKKRIGNTQHFRWMRRVAKKGRVMSKKGCVHSKLSVKILIVCSIIANCALEETPDTLRHRLLIF